MQDYVKSYISLIEDFLRERNETAEIILIGGLAMSYYGSPRYTIDIDGEIKCREGIYEDSLEPLKIIFS